MVLLKPKKGESRMMFLSRFLTDGAMRKEFPNQRTRFGVASSQFKRFK